MSSLSRSDLAGILFEEIESYLPAIDQSIALLQADTSDQEALAEIHRLFHNIKGAASQVAYRGLSNSAALCETVLAGPLETGEHIGDSFLEFLSSVNSQIRLFCARNDKTSEAETELQANTVSLFRHLLDRSGHNQAFPLPDSIRQLLQDDASHPKSVTTLQEADHQDLLSLRQECLLLIRSVLPLLQELAVCSSRVSTSLPVSVLRPIITAMSTLAYCANAAGLDYQEKLLRSFLDILYTYQENPEAADASAPALVQEFLSYLDLIFTLSPEESVQVSATVRQQLDRVLACLANPEGAVESPPDELTGFDNPFEAAFEDGLLREDETFLDSLSLTDSGNPSMASSDDEDAELITIFLEECAEHLQAINTELANFAIADQVVSAIEERHRQAFNRMRISIHTLKGAAAMTGFSHIASSAYALEKLLRWLHEESIDVTHTDLAVISEGTRVIAVLADELTELSTDTPKENCEFVENHLLERSAAAEISPAQTEQTDVTGIGPPPLVDSSARDDIQVPDLDEGFRLLPETKETITFSTLEHVTEADIITDLDERFFSAPSDPEGPEQFGSDEEHELLEIFRTECSEHLLTIHQGLNSLTNEVRVEKAMSGSPRDTISKMRRGVHTLKGAAAMTGFDHLAKSAHALEDLLDWLHDDARHITPGDVALIAESVDTIETFAQSPRAVRSADQSALVALIAEHLEQRIAEDGQPAEDSLEQGSESLKQAFAIAPEQINEEKAFLSSDSGSIRVKLEDLEELVNIEGELVVTRGTVEKLLDRFSSALDELNTIKDSLRRKSHELEVGFEAQSLYGFGPGSPLMMDDGSAATGATMSEFDPIELDRYSQLNLIIRSLNEITIDVNAIHAEMNALATSLYSQVSRQQLSMALMQEKLLRIRMTPLSSISSMLFRTVRQTAKRLAKDVQLQVTGEDVLMDRFIWSKTFDPLMHILRNCIDHGIEDAATRLARNKPATGHITIDAAQRGRMVVLRISDDGNGIDTIRLRQKLVADGLIAADSQLEEQDLYAYLFRPSVSTRDDVSEISGRGVGLDVVLRNIQELRGKVQIINAPGQGVTFELNIPITLSVNRAIIIELANRQYAIPIQDIAEVRRFRAEEILAGEEPKVNWQNSVISLHQLRPFLELPERPRLEGDALTLVVDTGDDHIALEIDRIDEQREVIIKDLGSHLRYVKGISGVTLTGEGTIIPILNLGELTAGRQRVIASSVVPAQVSTAAEPLKVLIVDDSISVRYSLSRLLEGQKYQPHQAIDGVDAVEKLPEVKPDVIILDIEMPRMNGYEFMAILRSNENYRDTPVIMLTSRASDKHRRKAEELGVNHYMTKPFQEDEFLGLLREMASRRQLVR